MKTVLVLVLVAVVAVSIMNAGVPTASDVRGAPTLSADLVNRILASAGSPAAGTGQALYDYALAYDIDDAYALAFFQVESSFGTTGVARITRSLGNIRWSQGYPSYGGYRAYYTWQSGYKDWYKLMRNLYIAQWNLTTVEQIIPVYAPSSDGNDVQAYIQAVKQDVHTWRVA